MRKTVLSCFLSLILFSNIFSISAFAQPAWYDMHTLRTVSDRYEDMHFINAKTGFVIHINGYIFKTTDGGHSFDSLTNTRLPIRAVGFFDENTGVMGTLRDTASMLRTTNSGNNWTKITNITGTKPRSICGISIVNSTTAYGVGAYYCPAYVVKTTDKGVSWTSLPLDSTKVKSLIDCYFWSQDSGIVVGGVNPTNNYNISNSVVLFTSNGGQSFTQVYKSTNTGEWGWKISFVNQNTGFVSIECITRGIILKTTNRGLNWFARNFTTTDDLEGIGFINENTGWIGGWSGPTFMTTNSGTSWSGVPWGRNLNRFRFISDTLGYAIGSSFYKFTREIVSVQPGAAEVPGSIQLYQNYPNPFNPTTNINYELRVSDHISLKIYDVNGSEISTLVNEPQRMGIHTVQFDGASLPSGIYYCKLATSEFNQTIKMVILK